MLPLKISDIINDPGIKVSPSEDLHIENNLRTLYQKALTKSKGDSLLMAKLLGVSLSTVYRLKGELFCKDEPEVLNMDIQKRALIIKALNKEKGKKAPAARALCLGIRHLYYLMDEYMIAYNLELKKYFSFLEIRFTEFDFMKFRASDVVIQRARSMCKQKQVAA